MRALPAAATLRSDGIETRYRREGSGSSVLFLAPADVNASLFQALVKEFRVVQPLSRAEATGPGGATRGGGAPPARAGGEDWIRGLIDGLGLGRCALVVAEPYCLSGLWFALSDPDRVSALVLVATDPGRPGGVWATAGDPPRRSLPILLVRTPPGTARKGTEGAARDPVLRFLRDTVAGTPPETAGTL